MLLILFIGNNKKVMGSHTNRRLGNVVGGIATLVMFGIGVVFLKGFFGL
jgi:Mn2+/Fe2+ NRAMP family transporter